MRARPHISRNESPHRVIARTNPLSGKFGQKRVRAFIDRISRNGKNPVLLSFKGLTRIAHQLLAATADKAALTRLFSTFDLDAGSTGLQCPRHAVGRKTSNKFRHSNLLHRLATKPGERCGLASSRLLLVSRAREPKVYLSPSRAYHGRVQLKDCEHGRASRCHGLECV